jgi:hypothetical protein
MAKSSVEYFAQNKDDLLMNAYPSPLRLFDSLLLPFP